MCSTLKDTRTPPFQDAFDWLCSFDKYGWIFGLERITFLLEQLGNPHHELKVIHVAGTNGKGSVCKYISSILQKAGYTVGLYLSPHVERFSERIVVNNKEISKEDFTRLVSQVRPFVDAMNKQNNTPTFFEIVTALAFLHFKDCTVDYAVVEVGLGGRFDATNVVNPLVSVITNISLEHTDILGKDIASIASEKAGIIKDHVPVVSAAVHDARVTIEQVAKQRNAPVTWIDQPMWKRKTHQGREQEFMIQGSFKDYSVKTSMLGQHQGENIALAIAAIEQLQMGGVYLTDGDIQEGIATAAHPGRMEIVSENPLILLDGAHNPAGMNMLVKTIREDFSDYRLILVLGVLKDKDVKTMASTIVPIFDEVIVTKSGNPRAADPQMLKEMITGSDVNKNVVVEDSIPRAIDHAKHIAKQKDLICVTGSLFTVGEARGYILLGKITPETFFA
ncbi:MAG TPA: folylpolyglutamate synthase/dihydrofolate synthase family protein [Candidatus Thermoplasmatota archaeon]|nr:folylpolyglutamate synthase/dihydrofolate synthase family protein [Candidatus Thermoplasmatota archaeon]